MISAKEKYYPIDAVLTWVDSSDVVWRKKINNYLPKKIDWKNKKASTRYNSVNEIEIAIVSIIKNASYIRNIFLVTDNQIPNNFEKLKKLALKYSINLSIVDHRVIFKGYEEFLPTFNSQSIETLLYRIPDLAEHFIYLNDDMFIIRETKPNDFFKEGKPVLRGKWVNYNEDVFVKKIFTNWRKKNKVTHRRAKEMGSKLVGFNKNFTFYHVPYPMRKSTFEKYFNENKNILISNIKHKFRDLEQFVPQSLINHIEIKNNYCFLDNNVSLIYFQTFRKFSKIKLRLKRMEKKYNNKALFMCLQSLELADKDSLRLLMNYLDVQLDSNFSETL